MSTDGDRKKDELADHAAENAAPGKGSPLPAARGWEAPLEEQQLEPENEPSAPAD